ncbi:hypothetical protein DAEQUDRAFT_764496 [Daedalea quercina L-15889]|uniref:Uncharacterized protein n=1 Tax=Daedalea quercina L-15889 TaxID=1314783 RepID=A0A165RDP9_9APHY|nr:hypothetical protein DAEQUDRAFT_764496 [Daedalea quercina L-15889]
MVSLKQVRDKNLIHLLVDRNASLDFNALKNNKGQTERTIAKEVGMEQELLSVDKRKANRVSFIDYLVSTAIFVVSYINIGMIKEAVKGVIQKVFNFTGKRDTAGVKEVAKDILSPNVAKEFDEKFNEATNAGKQPDPAADPHCRGDACRYFVSPRTAKDFQNVLTDYVIEFPRGDPFIQNLAARAAKLPAPWPQRANRYIKQRDLVSRIACTATKIVPDDFGVELRFINSRITKSNVTTEEIDQTLASVRRDGDWYDTAKGHLGGVRVRSSCGRGELLQATVPRMRHITDGEPTNEPQTTFKDAIVECHSTLDSHILYSTSVMFCVSQIGDDLAAEVFLDGLRNDASIQDVVHCTAEKLDDKFDELRGNESRLEEWILGLRLLTKPMIMYSYKAD